MDVILKEGIDLLNETGAKQSTSEEILEKIGSSGFLDFAKIRVAIAPIRYPGGQTGLVDCEPVEFLGKKKIHRVAIMGAGIGMANDYLEVTIDGTTYQFNPDTSNISGSGTEYVLTYKGRTLAEYSALQGETNSLCVFSQDRYSYPSMPKVGFLCNESISFKTKLHTNNNANDYAGQIGAYFMIYYEEL